MTWFERAVRDLTPPGADAGAASDIAGTFTGTFTGAFTDTFTDEPADAFETPDPTTASWGLDALDALGALGALGIDIVDMVVRVAYLTGDADLDGHDSPSAVFESILLDLELPEPESLGISLGVDGFTPVDATGFVGDEGGFTDATTSWPPGTAGTAGSAEAETTSVDPATRGDEVSVAPDTGTFDDPGLDPGLDSGLDPGLEPEFGDPADDPADELDDRFTGTAFTDDGEMPALDVWDDLQP